MKKNVNRLKKKIDEKEKECDQFKAILSKIEREKTN